MVKIKSDQAVAQQHATNLKVQTNKVTPANAGATNLSGVKDMVKVQTKLGANATKLQQASQTLSTKLNRVASGLSKQDQQVSQLWNQK
ncbi:TIGR04197 family type VII secretion effector [Bombilactobacillus thymidiniphilus]|uniref:TIGR04197 family type VII secretion effector n=1 Tax=Bombilactobacillus thymidiniphilus TaxID=2923363 RepID=A0ABY4PBL4_9LACO|nr:TIGR04197 family type VII secretion effector [Bombilactobacillus thymidiniphilus]UQS83005.1 TIGR04197 family type VII secretion effector [Bombilactobacillus thymidiniphilus]